MKSGTDILVYIALAEEFKYVKKMFSVPFKKTESKKQLVSYYSGKITAADHNQEYRLTLVPAGTMGNVNSATIISGLIDELKPIYVVVIGIAGSLSKDLLPGDVFIPSRVDDYLANGAAIGDEVIEYEFSGNYYDNDRRLVSRFQHFEIDHESTFEEWSKKSAFHLESEVSENMRLQLQQAGIDLRLEARIVAGDDRALASGPTVGKGSAFGKLLKSRSDRKIAAIEMESGGVLAASLSRLNPPIVLVIRGISDLATDKKAILEDIAGDSLRKASMRNVVTLLQAAIGAGMLPVKKKLGLLRPKKIS